MNLFIFLGFLGAFTKRAQLSFSAWLPAAIAAPTPVSALVHSSTLVTAGVYILIRQMIILNFNYIFNFFGKILLIIRVMTIFLARIAALGEKDIKKIIALSTLRQLGIIVI